MAPKKTTAAKRGADAVKTQPPTAKKAKTDRTLEAVLEAIKEVDLSDSCKQMLQVLATSCLNTPADARHESQTKFVKMIGEALDMAVATHQAAVDTAKAAVETSEATKAPMDEALAAAQAKLTAAKEGVTAQKTAVEEGATRCSEAEKTLKEKREEQSNGDAELTKAKEEKVTVDAAIETDLKAVVDGECATDVMDKHYLVLKPILAGLELDDSLKTALPATCKKEKAARGAFDNMVIEQLQKTLGERAEALAKVIENAAPAAEQRAAAVTAAEEALADAKKAQEAAQEALKGAEEADKAAAASVAEAEAALSTYNVEHKKVTEALAAKELLLQNFTTYNVSCFELLRDKVSKVEAPAAATTTAENTTKAPEEAATEVAKDAAVTVGGA